jgi:hypothetical protein
MTSEEKLDELMRRWNGFVIESSFDESTPVVFVSDLLKEYVNWERQEVVSLINQRCIDGYPDYLDVKTVRTIQKMIALRGKEK